MCKSKAHNKASIIRDSRVCVCEGGKSHIENDLKHARTLITNFPKAPVKWGKY